MTGAYAVEVEFAEKWQLAIGQNLNYSHQTGKPPGILLILETDADLIYWDRLRELVGALDEKGVSIQLWRIGLDEIEHPQNPPTDARNALRA